jgi:hypothetical protein
VTAAALATRLLQYSALLPQLIDAEPFLQFAVTLQGRIYPPLLAASGAMFCIGLAWFMFLKLHLRKGEQRLRQTNQKSLPQQAVGRADQYRLWATISLWVAAALGLASTLAVATTSAGIQYATAQDAQLANPSQHQNHTAAPKESSLPSSRAQDGLTITAGQTLIILHWCITACLVILATGMSVMYQEAPKSISTAQPPSAPKPGGPALVAAAKPIGAQPMPGAPRPA